MYVSEGDRYYAIPLLEGRGLKIIDGQTGESLGWDYEKSAINRVDELNRMENDRKNKRLIEDLGVDLAIYALVNQDVKAMDKWWVESFKKSVEHDYEKTNDSEIKNIYFTTEKRKVFLSCPQDKMFELKEKRYFSVLDLNVAEITPHKLTYVNLGVIDANNIPDEFEFIRELELHKWIK